MTRKICRHHPRHHRRHAAGAPQPHHQGRGRRRRPRQDRDLQPRQLDQGPHGGQDDRGRRARRPAQARRHDHRGHLRQHRHGPGDRRRGQGLQVHLHHHRQAVEGEGRRAARLRRRGHRLPDRRRARGSALLLLGVVAPRARDARTAGRPTSTTTRPTPRRTTSRPARRSGSRPTAGSITWWSASAPAARSAASASSSRSRSRRSRCGASTPTARCSRSTRRPASSTRTRSIPYITEGIGEDFLPQNVDFSVIDHFEKVTDRDAAIMTSRIAREEGIFAGNSAGSAMAGLLQLRRHFKAGETVVVIFHDHGTRYLGKMFNADWMREKGFIDRKGLTARDLVADRQKARAGHHRAHRNRGRGRAHHDRARLLADPRRRRRPPGRLGQRGPAVPPRSCKKPELLKGPVEAIMEPAFPFADISTGLEALAGMLTPESRRCWSATSRATRPTSSRAGT